MALSKIESSSLATGVGGKVLQVVTATDLTERSTTSTSFVTGSNTLSVSITPSLTSSKIFILTTGGGYNDTDNKYFRSSIYRGATNLGTSNGMYTHYDAYGVGLNFSMSYLDSPSSTSALTYQIYFLASATSISYINAGDSTSSITAMEISG
tara:strand:- start:240 stop:695 length:456 start_codon:yes stop_codon:yes gene_type:complete